MVDSEKENKSILLKKPDGKGLIIKRNRNVNPNL